MPNTIEIKSYHVIVYGSPLGYQNTRAQISLFNVPTKTAAFVRFIEPNQTFPNDYEEGGIIRMFLPINMFDSVMDLLRNEKPIYIYFTAAHAFLTTSQEPVGENE
jgi:hypothetical protein